MSLAEAAGALATLAPADKRGAVVQLGNITVINDCYNSNPTALNAMVDTLAAMPAKRRIVIAGEMLELGPTGEELHRRSGQHMAKKGIDILIGVRGLAKPMVEAARQAGMQAEFVATPEEAGEWLASEGSRGRCGAAEGVPRREAGTSFGDSRRSSVFSRRQIQGCGRLPDELVRLTTED